MWASLFAGLAAGLATNTSTIRTQTPYGSSYTTITTPDYYARAQFLEFANQAQSLGQSAVHVINQQYLHRTTLFPNNAIAGAVFFSRQRKATVTEATVTIAGNQFSFVFPPDVNVPPPIDAPLDNTSRTPASQMAVQTVTSGGPASSQATSPAVIPAIRCYSLGTNRLPFCPPASTSPAVVPLQTASSSPAEEPTLDLWSTPAGASIELDGEHIGNTPSTTTVQAGEHTITIRKQNFQTWQQTVEVTSGNVRVEAYMERVRYTVHFNH